ncbi:hypothetical protein P4O66_009353 [Electrophorus voltai]|uniref:Prostate transmembrane protein, androgen induced 1 n=1 Tax=Electrophorus voltai TaxID=2609070 RepID=A0AAD9DYS4_9TELE|nr:hypothetical protein P4O66_009353 [Electrophorus voltai]
MSLAALLSSSAPVPPAFSNMENTIPMLHNVDIAVTASSAVAVPVLVLVPVPITVLAPVPAPVSAPLPVPTTNLAPIPVLCLATVLVPVPGCCLCPSPGYCSISCHDSCTGTYSTLSSGFAPDLIQTQLEFVQILVIVVVMMMMVVVITCLLNHYRLSARSLISRDVQARQRHIPLTSDGSLWSSDASGSSTGMSAVNNIYFQQAYAPRPPGRVPPYIQREHLSRFQSTYPYLPHAIIDLPPNISLSDGEEPPPYQGVCSLQLRDPEQQLELNRESVRAPPNRTIFDSPFIDTSLCPPSVNAGVSAASLECAPPAYSEVTGHYYHPSSLPHHTETPAGAGVDSPSSLIQGNLLSVLPHISQITRNKEKQKAQQV